jgi:anti-anti-sigma factor
MQVDPASSAPIGTPTTTLSLNVVPEGNHCVIHVSGELDLSTRDQLYATSTTGDHPAMVIDLADVTFMDCCGYGTLIASARAVQAEGRSLGIRGQTGQPAHLMRLIAELEATGGPDSAARPTGRSRDDRQPSGAIC